MLTSYPESRVMLLCVSATRQGKVLNPFLVVDALIVPDFTSNGKLARKRWIMLDLLQLEVLVQKTTQPSHTWHYKTSTAHNK